MFGQVQGDKPKHYLNALDDARCQGEFGKVPGLIHKNEKHNPSRKCLLLIAKIEYEIDNQTVQLFGGRRPKSEDELDSLIDELGKCLEYQEVSREDQFQARVTIAWTQYWLGRYDKVVASLPSDLKQRISWVTDKKNVQFKYTYTVIVKAAFVRGAALRKLRRLKEAGKWLEEMFDLIKSLSRTAGTSNLPKSGLNPVTCMEYLSWYERFLKQFCQSSRLLNEAVIKRARVALSSDGDIKKEIKMDAFYEWKRFASMPQYPEVGQPAFALHEQPLIRVKCWGSYYDTMSRILEIDFLPQPYMEPQQLFEELKDVEDHFAEALTKINHFPAADQSTAGLDEWISRMAGNWKILMSNPWGHNRLGHEAMIELSQRSLEHLHRAAGLTYQSTRIYRLLFLVHLSLADFKHARLSLSIYVAILEKSKMKVHKSGEADTAVDSHAMALTFLSSGLEVLSQYGGSKVEVQLADQVRALLEQMVAETEYAFGSRKLLYDVEPEVIGRVHRAIGFSNFNYMLHDVSPQQRSNLERTAIKAFSRANHDEFRDQDNIFTLYSFALLLAESDDDSRAIAILKEVLKVQSPRLKFNCPPASAAVSQDSKRQLLTSDPDTRCCLLRCWHLLTLLLSRDEDQHDLAFDCIQSAFEPYGGVQTLRGSAENVPLSFTLPLEEGQCLVDLKMTEIALIKSQSGPGHPSILDKCEELTKLYANFLGRPMRVAAPERVTGKTASTKGFRKSLRVLSKGSEKYNDVYSSAKPSPNGSTGPTGSLAAPAIAITTDEASNLPQDTKHHQNFLGRHESNRLRKRASRKSLTSMSRSRANSPSATSNAEAGARGQPHSKAKPPDLDLSPQQFLEGNMPVSSWSSASQSPDGIGIAMTHDMPSTPPDSAGHSGRPKSLRTIPSAAKNMDRKNPNASPVAPKPPAVAIEAELSKEELASFYVPKPLYPKFLQERRNRTFLIGLWLFIAAQYRSENFFPDATHAIDEAQNQVDLLLENLPLHEGMSASNFTKLGFGGLKSYAETSADVICERGQLLQAKGDHQGALALFESALMKSNNHVVATVCLSEVLLDAYQPLHEAKERVAIKEGILNLGKYPKDQLLALLSLNSDVKMTKESVKEMTSGRDRAMSLLEVLSRSGRGWRALEVWAAYNRAAKYSAEPNRHKNVAEYELEMASQAPVRAYSILRSINQ